VYHNPAAGPSHYVGGVAALPEILADLEGLLEPAAFSDYCPNGLQVAGREQVGRIVTGVSARLELFERAVAQRADLVLVHHGLFWDSGPLVLDRRLKRRLLPLLQNDISLLAYHLPLDAHPQVGNNAILCRALGGEELQPFAEHRGRSIGFIARLNPPLAKAELAQRLAELCRRRPLHLDYGPAEVERVAVVSGAGSSYFEEALALGAQAFITGEPAERVLAVAAEERAHFFAAGHYATETFGVRALGERLAERFAVDHLFIDLPNPI